METIKLVKGEFSKHDAQEILMTLLNDKIKFHELKNFSSNEMLGQDHKISVNRIPELKEAKLKILDLIKDLNDVDTLSINADITIKFGNENK